jgi:hypothetical protein
MGYRNAVGSVFLDGIWSSAKYSPGMGLSATGLVYQPRYQNASRPEWCNPMVTHSEAASPHGHTFRSPSPCAPHTTGLSSWYFFFALQILDGVSGVIRREERKYVRSKARAYQGGA